jgi:multisubunit Na+/H+ antiporter MnhG subunit
MHFLAWYAAYIIIGNLMELQTYCVLLRACPCIYLRFALASAGSNGTNVFAASTAQFCLVMLVLNMFVKVASLYYFQHLHKTVAAELIGRAKQQPNRRASTNLALKQAHKEGGKGDVLLTPNSSTKSSSGANYQNIQQQQQHHQQHHQHGIHDGHESDGSDNSFSMSPDRRQKASEA